MPKAKSTGQRAASKSRQEAQRKAKKQMWAVVLFAVGILLFLMTIIEGQAVWAWLHRMWRGLFGFSSYLLAPLLIYIAVCSALDKPVVRRSWEAIALILLLSGAIQIFGAGMPETEGFFGALGELYQEGAALKGGGVLSGVFGLSLIALFGETPAKFSIVLLLFVFVMLVSGTTLRGLIQGAAKPVKKIEETYAASVAKMEERREQKQRFNIDVSLGDDAPADFALPEEMEQPPEKPAKSTAKTPKNAVKAPPIEMEDPTASPEVDAARDRLLGSVQAASAPSEAQIPYIEDIVSKYAKPAPAQEDEVIVGPLPDDGIQTAVTAEPEGPQDSAPWSEEPTAEPAPEADNGLAEVTINASSDAQQLGAVAPEEADDVEVPLEAEYILPDVGLLNLPPEEDGADLSEELKANAALLVDTLSSFGVSTRIIDISRGPAVTRYELQPAAGVKINRITSLADDIALNLAASGVRIEAPIPNKAAVGIEVPNKKVSAVPIREIIDSPAFREAGSRLTMALGKDIAGNVTVADIAKMPHLLIAGSTGSGKSVCINSIIMSLLYKARPEEVKFLMIDPKVVELGCYNGIPHLLVPVVTDPRKAAGALAWAVGEMLRRYKTFADTGVRDLSGYNETAREKGLEPMPQVVLIIDELADLMMASPGDVEDSICRLAQMARAAGMHLIIATQRPSVDVITGVIKANIPSRIAFAVSSQVDSRTILDMGGAEKLLGRGDMLFYPVGSAKPVRVQGCFVTEKEIERVIAFIKEGGQTHDYSESILSEIERNAQAVGGKKGGGGGGSDGGGFDEEDDMLPQAIECVIEAGQASTSLLQRRLKLGYARAARIVDQLEEKGIVGPFEGSKPRQVLISKERWIEMKLNEADRTEG